MKALNLFDAQRFCFQDGPGIRTTVFTKGCSLRCAWCHNPESWRSEPELLYYAGKCRHCGLCAMVCPSGAHEIGVSGHLYTRHKCRTCGACSDVCPARALQAAGSPWDTVSLLEEILRDKDVYDQSGGGMTVSGGEPLLQPEPLCELLSACRGRGVHTALETAGNVPEGDLAAVLPHVDLVLWDIKAASPELHKRATGAGNARILANLDFLFSRFIGELWIRIPVIPGFNDTEEELEAIRRLLRGKRISRVELLPYHSIAISKYRALGMDYGLSGIEPPDGETMQRLRGAVSGDWVVV